MITRSYPAADDLYQYPFVHRRVLAYTAAGHPVAVFRPSDGAAAGSHAFEGVTCVSGDVAALRELLARFSPDVIAAHGFEEGMHAMLDALGYPAPTCAWLHGSEIPGFFRAKALAIADPDEQQAALEAVARRRDFWNAFLGSVPPGFRLVLPSRSAIALAREDMGDRLDAARPAAIPNPIDTDLFRYRRKAPEDRLKVLVIRPFDSRTYGNDLAVSAILRLCRTPVFERLRFTIFGDGPLFSDTLATLPQAANIAVHRHFLTQPQIVEQHATHGIFLVPTRLDTQGVSRDEAMSSGLVPVTNRAGAVPEFVDGSCAALVPADDAEAIADAIAEMAADPELFLARSAQAAARVRRQSGHEVVIPAELALLAGATNG